MLQQVMIYKQPGLQLKLLRRSSSLILAYRGWRNRLDKAMCDDNFKFNARPLIENRPARYRPRDPAIDAWTGLEMAANAARDGKEQAFYAHVLHTLDFDAYAEMQTKHLEEHGSGSSRVKWLDLAHYLRVRYSYVVALGLDQRPPLRLLDIACGPGHFGYICRFFGHDVLGIDVPGNEVLNDLIDVLAVPRVATPIKPKTPLPDIGRFDYVTAFHANFHWHKHYGLFNYADWALFMEDLLNQHLTAHGQVYLHMNDTLSRPGVDLEDAAFAEFVAAHGGCMLERRTIVIDDAALCPKRWQAPLGV